MARLGFARSSLLSLITLFVWVGLASGQSSGAPLVVGASHTIESRELGEDRVVWVSTPESYAFGEARYPVLYLLDGDAHLHTAAGLTRFFSRFNRMPEMIIVGVLNTNRRRDLTPAIGGVRRTNRSGGGEDFLRFLTDELRPFVEREYRTEDYSVLVGHSLGGLLTVHSWLTRPDAFDAHIAISPAVYWGESASIAAARAELPSRGDRNDYLFIGLGEFEGRAITDATNALVEVLEESAPESMRWTFQDFPGENHQTVPYDALHRGLRDLFEGWRMPFDPVVSRVNSDGSLDAFNEHFEGLSERYGFEVLPPEVLFRLIGNSLEGDDAGALRIELYQRWVELHPWSVGGHDALGQAYERDRQLQAALAAYERAVELAERYGHPAFERVRGQRDSVRGRLR